MISPERDHRRPESKARRLPEPKQPSRNLNSSFTPEYDFIQSRTPQGPRTKNPLSMGTMVLDQVFICSLSWMKICAVALITNASLVRLVDLSQVQALMTLVCIYGITFFNYQLVFMALKRPTLGQSLHH